MEGPTGRERQPQILEELAELDSQVSTLETSAKNLNERLVPVTLPSSPAEGATSRAGGPPEPARSLIAERLAGLRRRVAGVSTLLRDVWERVQV